MAQYIFNCNKCKKDVELTIPINDYDEQKDKQVCKKCGSKMTRVFTDIGLTTYGCTGFYDTDNRGKLSR